MIKTMIAQIIGTLMKESVVDPVALFTTARKTYPAPSTTGKTVVSKLLVGFSDDVEVDVEVDESARATREGKPPR
jgi:hypothetical protein